MNEHTDTKVDIVNAYIISQNEEALKGYEFLVKSNGSLKEFIENANEKGASSYRYDEDLSYASMLKQAAREIGRVMVCMQEQAGYIKSALHRAERQYWDSWGFCAQAARCHPDYPKHQTFCEDYRRNHERPQWAHEYKVNEEILHNLMPGSAIGRIIKIDGEQLTILTTPSDKRCRKKEVTTHLDSLLVFPLDMRWRKVKEEREIADDATQV